MPSRVIRAEINCSASLSRVSEGADLLFRALLLAADDYGRMDARLVYIKSTCFPLRDSMTHERIAELVRELQTCDPDGEGPVIAYEVDGRPYIALRNWERHRSNQKRALRSRIPDPPLEPRASRRSTISFTEQREIRRRRERGD